jgi:hypothetical protein
MRSNRLAGHELPNEGRIFPTGSFYSVPKGSTRCSCGEESPVLSSVNARKRWHREHKDAVRAAAGDPS